MNEFNELLEGAIEEHGLPAVIESIAEICRNRGNIQREDGPPFPDTARRWTHCGAVLFNAATELQRSNPMD